MQNLGKHTVYADIENVSRTRLKPQETTRDVYKDGEKLFITIGWNDIPVSPHGDGYKVNYPLGVSFNMVF